MQIQSLSVVVPSGTKGNVCINHCESCPGRMHDSPYANCMSENVPGFGYHVQEYIKRLEFARHNGCNTVMLTGSSEPQQNRKFLAYFGMMQKMMKDPFQWVEMQTTGTGINAEYIDFLRSHVGLSLLSLSVFSLSDDENIGIIHPPKGMAPCITDLVEDVKSAGLSLRLSLNMTEHFDKYAENPGDLFDALEKIYEADQVTLRVLYESGNDLPEDRWVREHAAKPETIAAFRNYIRAKGRLLGTLSYGTQKWGVHGMSTVLDDDSMGKDTDKRESQVENYKYLILRENAKLYSEWDDPASLIF